jgi:hypothetical protein
MKTWLTGMLLMASAAVVNAAPLKLHGGASVRVAVHGKRESGVGLKMKDRGWRLEVGAARDGEDVADAVDVTDGAHDARWTLEVRDGALFFDEERFIAGHAYRLVVRHGGEERGTALVYLYPPALAAKSKISFDDEAAPTGGSGDDDELMISKKPTL